MSKNKGGREVRKPKQEKKPKAEAQGSSALSTQPVATGKQGRGK